jgi:hypothetical protein
MGIGRYLYPLIAGLLSTLVAPSLLAAPNSADAALRPYTAHYSLSKGPLTVAKGKYQLRAIGKNCYVYSGHAQTSGVVSIFKGDEIEQKTRFCIADGKVRPQFYRFHHKGGDADHNFTLTFDWDNHTVATQRGDQSKPDIRKIPKDAQDSLSMQVLLRRQLSAKGESAAPIQVHLVTRKHIRHYTFQIEDKGKLTTHAGTYKTIKMQRKNPDDKQIRFWLAPKLAYLPVKIKRSDPGLTLNLIKLPQSPLTKQAGVQPQQHDAANNNTTHHGRGF